MLTYFSILPAILLLVNSVNSANLHKNGRVQRQVQRDRSAYSSNHPPSVENFVPVTVIYDKEEDINVLGKSIEQDNSTSTSNTTEVKNSSGDSTITFDQILVQQNTNDRSTIEELNLTTSVPVTNNKEENDDATVGTISSVSAQTTESEIKAREQPQDKETPTPNNKTNNIRQRTQRRRLLRVNKAQVDNIFVVGDNNSKDTAKNIAQKELTSRKHDENHKNNTPPIRKEFPRRTQPRDPIVPIVESENYVYAYKGDFHYSYEGGDGTKVYEIGELKTVDDGSSGTGVVGGFSYTDKDGNDFSLSYTADENGYRPVGAHLPTPPPIPPAIQRALELLATKTTPEPITEKTNNSY